MADGQLNNNCYLAILPDTNYLELVSDYAPRNNQDDSTNNYDLLQSTVSYWTSLKILF